MADKNERPAYENGLPEEPLKPELPIDPAANLPDAQQSNGSADDKYDPTIELKKNLAQYRLPPELRDEILAGMPPPEERERLYRELIENGGMSFEELIASLDLEAPSDP